MIEFHSTLPGPLRVADLSRTHNPPSLKVVPDRLLARLAEEHVSPLVDKFAPQNATFIGTRLRFLRRNVFFISSHEDPPVGAALPFPRAAPPLDAPWLLAPGAAPPSAVAPSAAAQRDRFLSFARSLRKDIGAARTKLAAAPTLPPFVSWVGPGAFPGGFVAIGSSDVFTSHPLFSNWTKPVPFPHQTVVTRFFKELLLALLGRWLAETELYMLLLARAPAEPAPRAAEPSGFLVPALGAGDHAVGLRAFAAAVLRSRLPWGHLRSITGLDAFLGDACQAVQRELDERVERYVSAKGGAAPKKHLSFSKPSRNPVPLVKRISPSPHLEHASGLRRSWPL